MGTWEILQPMVTRAEVRGWKQPQKTSDAAVGSQRGHSSLRAGKPPHGEGPQLKRWVRSNPVECEGLGILAEVNGALNTVNPLRRSPCAMKVARTVATGGMGKHSSAVRPVPTHWDSPAGGSPAAWKLWADGGCRLGTAASEHTARVM